MTTKVMVTVDFPWTPPHNHLEIVNSTATEFGASVGPVKWVEGRCAINVSFQQNDMAKLSLLAQQFNQKVKDRPLAAIRDPRAATTCGGVEAPGTADGLLRQDEWLVCMASRRSGIRRSMSLGGSFRAGSDVVGFRRVTVV
jgi:hypothetical protein